MPKLTKRLIDGLSSKENQHYIVWDDEIKGFGVRVMPSGRKTYLFRYRVGMRDRKIKIGVHGSITAEQARIMAKDLSSKTAFGQDPADKKAHNRFQPTLQELAQEYLEKHGPKKRPSSLQEDKDMLRQHILPLFSKFKIRDITKRDIEGLHTRMKDTPYRANRVLSLLSKMFSLAVGWGWKDSNPAMGIKRYPEHKRERWLNEEELARLLEQLETYSAHPCAHAIKLLLFTGARKSEVLKATWDQFDLQRGFWVKPAHNTKQNKTEHLPLSPEAISFLSDIKRYSSSLYICPGRIEGQPLKELKSFWKQIVKKAQIPDVRIHDLRHTYASHLASNGLGLLIIGKLLGHKQASTTQRYAHLANTALQDATNIFSQKLQEISKKNAQPLSEH